MIIYLSVYIVLLCVAFFEFFDDRVTNHYLKLTLFVTVILYLLVLTGSRFEVGADFSSYLNIFNRVNTLAEGAAYSSLEPGFKLIILFFKGLNFPPYLLFFVFAAILFTFLGKGLYRSSKLPFLSLFIFVMVFWIGYVFNVLRQGIAMAILIYLIKDIHERNFKKVLFFSLVASTIHFTGVFILIGYFIYPLFLRQSVFIGMTLMSIVYYLNSMVFFDLIASLLPGGFQAKLIDYMSRFPGGVDLTSYLLRLIILGIFLWFYKSLENEKQKESAENTGKMCENVY